MISLPPALAPWSKQLELFPQEIALALGPMVQRIAAAIGPLPSADAEGREDPDGFDGLVNRGSYEHLIASDWLLAEEIPEEFERRAAMSEHLFLKAARLDRAQSFSSMALFDAGPDQLGSPRLAHLAALVVLMRRAEKAQAHFSWGILQRPDSRLLHGAGKGEVLALLRARSSRLVSDAELREWVNRAVSLNKPEEVWLVGGTALPTMAPPHLVSQILVEDLLEPGSRRLSVDICRAKGKSRRVFLALPPDNTCAKLLRDPYEARVTAAAPFSIQGNLSDLLFSSRHLFATVGGGTLLSFRVPRKPQLEQPKVKRYANDKTKKIVAVGRIGQATVVISLRDQILHLSAIGQPKHRDVGDYDAQGQFIWPAEGKPGLLLPCVSKWTEKAPVLVLDAAGNLFHLREKAAVLYESDVLALSTQGAIFSKERGTVNNGFPGPVLYSPKPPMDRPPAQRAFFGFSADGKPTHSLCAIQTAPHHWHVIRPYVKQLDLEPNASSEVVGVIQPNAHADALVTLQQQRHTVMLEGCGWKRTLFESSEPIACIAVSEDDPWIAYSTVKGDVAVYSVDLGKDLCRFVNWREK